MGDKPQKTQEAAQPPESLGLREKRSRKIPNSPELRIATEEWSGKDELKATAKHNWHFEKYLLFLL